MHSIPKKEMHSRDTTVLIDLLWFNVMHYSSLFQYFFWSNFLVYLLTFFEKIIIMIMINVIITGEPTSKQWQFMYLLSEKKTLRCQLCSTCYAAVWINDCLKRTYAIKVATMKLRTISGSHHVPTTKLTLFVEGKDEWDTKEGSGKFMMNALHVQQCSKRHLSGWSNVEQWKNQASQAEALLSYASLKASVG